MGQRQCARSIQRLDFCAERVALQAGNRVKRVERVGLGGENSCPMEMRVIVGAALRAGAASLALAHSHPSGDLQPSAAAIALIRTLVIAAGHVGLRLVDHVILAGTRWTSLNKLGYLEDEATPQTTQGW